LTDSNGYYNGDIVLEKPGEYEVTAFFKDSSHLYKDSWDSRNVIFGNITGYPLNNTKKPDSLLLIIGIPLFVILAVIFYFLGRYQLKHRKVKRKVSIVGVTPSVSTPPIATLIHAYG
jgi:hypothetical protein